MTQKNSLWENLKILFFIMVVMGVYLLRYFTHETNITKTEEYYPVALMATGVFYLLLILFFGMVINKGGDHAYIWCLIFAGASAGVFLHKNTLGGIYLYLAMIFILMAMICVWGRFFVLLIPLYVLGIYLYPGFFLLGAPMILGPLGYQSKLRPVQRVLIIAGIVAGGVAFYNGIHSIEPLWEDKYGILSKFHPYMEFSGMDDSEMVHTAKIIELIVFAVMISPYIYMYFRTLRETGWQAKYLSFLLAGVMPLVEYITQEHPGQVVYFIVCYYMMAVILPVIWRDAVWQRALGSVVERVRALPGWIIFIIYPMCLFPFRRGMICLASRWVTEFIMFRLYGVEV